MQGRLNWLCLGKRDTRGGREGGGTIEGEGAIGRRKQPRLKFKYTNFVHQLTPDAFPLPRHDDNSHKDGAEYAAAKADDGRTPEWHAVETKHWKQDSKYSSLFLPVYIYSDCPCITIMSLPHSFAPAFTPSCLCVSLRTSIVAFSSRSPQSVHYTQLR